MSADKPRLEVRADDGARLILTDAGDGRVSLSVAQTPDRVVSVRLPPDAATEVGEWLGLPASSP